jgi:hypothetical protein
MVCIVYRECRTRVFVGLLLGTLSGCALSYPDIKEIWDADFPADPSTNTPKITGTAQIEFEIKKRVFCELRDAVHELNKYFVTHSKTPDGPTTKTLPLLPPTWGAQITLSLQVDQSISVSPGITLNEVLPTAERIFGVGKSVNVSQSFGFGFGGTLSSTATRIDKFNPYYTIAELAKPNTKYSVCHPENDPFVRLSKTPASSSPFILESDLGIKDWLVGAMFVNRLLPSSVSPDTLGPSAGGGAKSGGSGGRRQEGGGGTRPDTVSYQTKFVIVSNGNVALTWKLLRVSTATSPLLSGGRTRTHDLIITIGPPTVETSNRHIASEIGAAVGGATRAVTQP